MKVRGAVVGRRESEFSDDPPQVRVANDRGLDVWLPGDFKRGQEVEVTVTAVPAERPARRSAQETAESWALDEIIMVADIDRVAAAIEADRAWRPGRQGEPCKATHSLGRHCGLVAGHDGLHTWEDGYRWPSAAPATPPDTGERGK